MYRIFALVFFCSIIILLALYPKRITYHLELVTIEQEIENLDEYKNESILFTGDIMLGRHVENLMKRYGSDYPFLYFNEIASGSTFVVSNFESSMSSPHSQTPSGAFTFSVDSRYIGSLTRAGITHVSLANNHALDYGYDGFLFAADSLNSAAVNTFGHPTQVTSNSISYIRLDDTVVAIIGIHTLFSEPDFSELKNTFDEAVSSSDLQVAYIHWGTEYEMVHSGAQESFARKIIPLGADVIIGHHPHVIQDIDLIDGVPIFYSLGNMIFDQYFSSDVQSGIAIQMSIPTSTIEFRIIPYSSIEVRSQPKILVGSSSVSILANISERGSKVLQKGVGEGYLSIPFRP